MEIMRKRTPQKDASTKNPDTGLKPGKPKERRNVS
jgi:hypothetical protein